MSCEQSPEINCVKCSYFVGVALNPEVAVGNCSLNLHDKLVSSEMGGKLTQECPSFESVDDLRMKSLQAKLRFLEEK